MHLSGHAPIALLVTIALGAAIGIAQAEPARAQDSRPPVSYAEQGWSPADRDTFYTTSQGSLMMPYAWFKALRRLDTDQPFGGDQLRRYGYLQNERSRNNPEGLPVGFVITGNAISGDLGMTCAACHTGQLEYQKDGQTRALRLDGAPANADFQTFLTELTEAARKTISDRDRFNNFARDVLGGRFSAARAAQLKIDFGAFVQQFGDFMDASLPALPWGSGRLDAFGMIFNRVAGRDLDIKTNFKTADAPVSYPFLWNASRQDRTQWNGGVPNGLYIQAIGRNTGEVFGVFARFKPRRIGPHIPPLPPFISFVNNSASFPGLQKLEEQIVKLRPPPWPRAIFGFEPALADQGKPLFEAHCKSCHSSDVKSATVPDAWSTPVKAVGTDPKMARNAERSVDPGILKGSLVPQASLGTALENPAKAHDVLAVSVVGTLINQAAIEAASLQPDGVLRALREDTSRVLPDKRVDLRKIKEINDFIKANLAEMFRPVQPADSGAAYESRALHGIWATAPYLHNGSVPNLWELLKPARERKMSFKIGSRTFDPKNVGYDTQSSPFRNGDFVADAANQNGNGNGGHEYGTGLTESERWAVIEYLKGL